MVPGGNSPPGRPMPHATPINTPCGYCFERWAEVYDHILPKSYGGSNSRSNLLPACSRCNGLVGSRVFDSLEEKRNFIRRELGLPDLPVFGSLPPLQVGDRPVVTHVAAKKPPRAGRMVGEGVCEVCGEPFPIRHQRMKQPKRFCSGACRMRANVLKNGCRRCRGDRLVDELAAARRVVELAKECSAPSEELIVALLAYDQTTRR